MQNVCVQAIIQDSLLEFEVADLIWIQCLIPFEAMFALCLTMYVLIGVLVYLDYSLGAVTLT